MKCFVVVQRFFSSSANRTWITSFFICSTSVSLQETKIHVMLSLYSTEKATYHVWNIIRLRSPPNIAILGDPRKHFVDVVSSWPEIVQKQIRAAINLSLDKVITSTYVNPRSPDSPVANKDSGSLTPPLSCPHCSKG